jgi:aspartyl-tRNA(Asn)/glutamyl-tRNA(Gln) amidotransferase subunit C
MNDHKGQGKPCRHKPFHSSKKRTIACRLVTFAPMELNREITQKIADLARLEFSEQELDAIQQDLAQMISFVEKLNEIDTSAVEPLTHITAEGNRLREDEIKGSVDNATALKNAPSAMGEFFTVPKVINKK